MQIHIFNPDTDYALACGRKFYSPPASILQLRRKMALFPAYYASPRDAILLLDPVTDSELRDSPHHDLTRIKEFEIVGIDTLAEFISRLRHSYSSLSFQPWGWNHTLLKTLLNAGVPSRLLKTDEQIDTIRELSHRRTTIPFQATLSELLPHLNIRKAHEFLDIPEAINFMLSHPGAYFKAPWSSSGRGVIDSSAMSESEVSAWIGGCIRRQGSVIGEQGRKRTGDFATEWTCSDGKAVFLGLSVFNTSASGRYLGNIYESQSALWERIEKLTPQWNRKVIEAQKSAIEALISPRYDGPLGIDMFSTVEGDLNPCVEINLRKTMGLATLLSANRKSASEKQEK